MYKLALFFGLVFLSACSTHPITGRDQILPLPAVQAAYADIDYVFSTVAKSITVAGACTQDCVSAESAALFVARVKVIGAQLDASARDTSPKLFERAVKFRIEVSNALGVGTASSAGGRIALGAGLASLEPSDTVITFLIAREMAHVIARHAEENSGASMVFSALGMLVPGVNVLLRFAATTLGSGALKSSWATQQQREADEIAVALLERTGLTAGTVARSLAREVRRTRLPADEWGTRYLESMQRVAQTAAASLYAAKVDD
jgi:Zn-dependent protease with chaperone function